MTGKNLKLNEELEKHQNLWLGQLWQRSKNRVEGIKSLKIKLHSIFIERSK